MFKTQETKVLGSIRKIKKYGACGVILGMAALAIAFSGGEVSADELVARQSVSNTVQETISAPVKVEAVSETGYPSTNLTEKQPEPTAEHVEMTNNANKAGKEIVSPVETPELDNAVKKAKGAGVEVTEKPQVTYDTLAEAKTDEKNQVKAIEEAKAEKIENTKAIKTANDTNAKIKKENEDEEARVKKLNEEDEARVKQANEKEVARVKQANDTEEARVKRLNEEIANENKAKMEALGLTYTGDLEKDKKAIADYLDKAKNENKRSEEQYKLSLKNSAEIHKENKAIMEAKGLTYTGVWATDKAAVDQWNKENAGVKIVALKQTGLTATANTTFEPISGATKIPAPARTPKVIQGRNLSTNLDAKFDNVFLFDAKDGVAEIKVKNTSHGDVTLKFSGVTPSPDSAFTASYVALWYGEDGGIGYGVFTGAGSGTSDGGGVDGQSGDGGNGAYYNDRNGWVKQVSVTVATDAEDISDVTINDVDSDQIIRVSPMGNAKVTTGKNITQNGNTFTANDSAESQSTAGVLDSNGIGWSYEKGQKIHFWFDHINSSDTSLSIVGGLFGRASQKEVKENVEPISIKKVEDTNFTPKKTDPVELKKPVEPKLIEPKLIKPDPEDPVLKPYVPVPKEEKISVEYHKTAVKYAPKISKGVVNDDNVNIDGKLVPKGSIVNWTLNTGVLKAGREEMADIELKDPLESGYLLDTEATAKVNPTLEFTHNGQGRTLIKFGARELAKVNANLDKDYVMPQIKLIGTVLNDNGFYNNTYSMTLTTKSKKKYTVTSNTPKVKTSGSKPVKDVVDNKGVSINGKSVLPTTELNYKFTQNFSNYKGIEASKSAIMKNFLMIDDPDENALDTSTMHVKSITAGNKDVSELLQMYRVLSMESLDEKLRKIITDSGISPVGEFYMWAAKDPESFYEAYLKKGLDIIYNFSFKIKKTFTEGDIVNAVHQIDFGNGYAGNKVVNHLPKPEVHKDVLNAKGESIDGKEVQLGDLLTYKLEGWVIPADRGYDLFEYRFVDTLDVEHDEYQGFMIEAMKNFVLTNGTVIKAGDDLKGYTETIYNARTGLFETRFTKDFLSSIPRTSEFGADVFLKVKRIKHGEVFNEYDLFVNATPVLSNEVKTYSNPEPTPSTQNELPNTGEGSSMLGVAGLIMSLSTAGFMVTMKRKEN